MDTDASTFPPLSQYFGRTDDVRRTREIYPFTPETLVHREAVTIRDYFYWEINWEKFIFSEFRVIFKDDIIPYL